MNALFSALWAAICAFFATRLIMYLGVEFNWTDTAWVYNSIHYLNNLGFAVKNVIFFSFFLLFWATGISKLFGNVILSIIGWAGLLICAGAVVMIAYYVLNWFASML